MRFCLLAGVLTLGFVAVSQAQMYRVTSQGDGMTIDGQCTMREAVAALNGSPNGDCGTNSGGPGMQIFSGAVTLAGTELVLTNAAPSGVQIQGFGATVSADNLSRVFRTESGVTLTINDLIIRDGRAPDAPPGSEQEGGYGGCILAEGPLVITNSTVTNCRAGDGTDANPTGSLPDRYGTAGGYGGAVAGLAALTITNSMVSYGQAGNGGNTPGVGTASNGGRGGYGGNIFAGATLTLEGSVVEHGRAGDGGTSSERTGGNGGVGGGIFGNVGPQVIRNTVVRNNTAGDGGSNVDGGGGAAGLGGGIYSSDGLTLEDSDVHDNTSGLAGLSVGTLPGGLAGGVYASGTFVIERSSIRDNATAPGRCDSGRCGSVGAGAGLFAGTGSTGQLNDVTVSGNAAASNESLNFNEAASEGAGIYSRATSLTVRRSTITGNSLPASTGTSSQHDQFLQGSGIYVDAGTATLESTIVAENSTEGADNDIGMSGTGSFATSGFNLIGDPDMVTTFVDGVSDDQVGVTGPVVDPIQFTSASPAAVGFHLPAQGGPAIDAGTCGGSTSDVRGQARPLDNLAIANADDGCDIGNAERIPPVMDLRYTVTTLADNRTTDGQCTLREAVDAVNGQPSPDCSGVSGSGAEIVFSVSGTVLLGGTELELGSDVTIDGGGTVTVDADSLSRVFHTLPAADVTLKALTIQEGKAPDAPGGSEEAGGFGGCILAEGALTILNSTVTDCRAGDGIQVQTAGGILEWYGTAGGYGGSVAGLDVLTITNSTVSYGRAGNGGDAAGNAGRGGYGGNIFASVALTVEGSVVEHGRSGDGGTSSERSGGGGGVGGGIFGDAGPQLIRNTVILNNAAGDGGSNVDSGGGAAGSGGGIYSSAGLTLEDSDVQGNTSGVPGFGVARRPGGEAGGVYAAGTFVIRRSSIRDNITTRGGCDFVFCKEPGFGAGLFAGTSSNGTLVDATISGNINGFHSLPGTSGRPTRYTRGAGIYSRAATLAITRSTITGNAMSVGGGTPSEEDQFSEGAGIYVDAGTTTLTSSIVFGNTADTEEENIASVGTFATGGFNLIGNPDAVTTFVDGVSDDQVGVTAPVVESIQFTSGSPAAVGFHPLVLGGPAIDAGTCGGSTSDVRGQTRPFDDPNITDADDGCDVGNVEMQQSGVAPVAGDCDANGQVDARDFIRWQSENGGSGLTCDMNNDSTVDFADFLIILNNNGL